MRDLSLFTHTYINNQASRTLFLLHGTGGTEHDFLFFDDLLGNTYNLLGLRGNIREGNANRFFRRFEEGVFDIENIKEEAGKLSSFIRIWMEKHTESLTFLGYSNGANMILTMLFLYPSIIPTALLLHPMLPIDVPQQKPDLTGLSAFVSSGNYDTIVSDEESTRVTEELTSCGAQVLDHRYDAGHQIGEDEIRDIVTFLKKHARKE